jgi:zinc protease
MGYKVPTVPASDSDWEPYALDVLAYLLDGGDYARLPKTLVRGSQIAAAVSASYSPHARLATLFMFSGVPAAGHTVADLEAALLEQIERVRSHPVDPAELERVKTRVVAGNVFKRDSIFYQAMEIGRLETVGLSWREAERYVDRIRAVTAEQVQAVAAKYLVADRLTVAVLDPQPMAQDDLAVATPPPASHRH